MIPVDGLPTSGTGEPESDGVDMLERLQDDPYPRVRYFMTASVPNADFSLFGLLPDGGISSRSGVFSQ
jgi:hypothetical protein